MSSYKLFQRIQRLAVFTSLISTATVAVADITIQAQWTIASGGNGFAEAENSSQRK